MAKYKLKECNNFKKYKAIRKPTCGCQACNEKFNSKPHKKAVVEKIEVIELDADGQRLADNLSAAIRRRG